MKKSLLPHAVIGTALAAGIVAATMGATALTADASAPGPVAPAEMLAPVYTFDQAIAQCESTYADITVEQSDCINAAIVAWGMFEPNEPAITVEPAAPVEPLEDEAGFDCRIHGNQMCGTEIMGAMYNVTFESGIPVGVVAQ